MSVNSPSWPASMTRSPWWQNNHNNNNDEKKKNDNNREFIDGFQLLEELDNVTKEKHGMYKYPHNH